MLSLNSKVPNKILLIAIDINTLLIQEKEYDCYEEIKILYEYIYNIADFVKFKRYSKKNQKKNIFVSQQVFDAIIKSSIAKEKDNKNIIKNKLKNKKVIDKKLLNKQKTKQVFNNFKILNRINKKLKSVKTKKIRDIQFKKNILDSNEIQKNTRNNKTINKKLTSINKKNIYRNLKINLINSAVIEQKKIKLIKQIKINVDKIGLNISQAKNRNEEVQKTSTSINEVSKKTISKKNTPSKIRMIVALNENSNTVLTLFDKTDSKKQNLHETKDEKVVVKNQKSIKDINHNSVETRVSDINPTMIKASIKKTNLDSQKTFTDSFIKVNEPLVNESLKINSEKKSDRCNTTLLYEDINLKNSGNSMNKISDDRKIVSDGIRTGMEINQAEKSVVKGIDLKIKQDNVNIKEELPKKLSENGDDHQVSKKRDSKKDSEVLKKEKKVGVKEKKPKEEIQTISYTVVSPTNEVLYHKEITSANSISVEDLLIQSGLDINNSNGFIESINGISNQKMAGWVFEVNNAPVMVSAADYIINPNEQITWKYVDFSKMKVEKETFAEEKDVFIEEESLQKTLKRTKLNH